jgi:hypothetical protein
MSWGYWSNVAPAAVSNYCTRVLLGRAFMCTAAAAGPVDLRQEHAQYALAKLATYDVLLAVGHNELNDVVFRHGLRWTNGTLRWGVCAGKGGEGPLGALCRGRLGARCQGSRRRPACRATRESLMAGLHVATRAGPLPAAG